MNNWSLSELVPYLSSECSRLNIPLFAPSREIVMSIFLGAGLSPYRTKQGGNLYGPSWLVNEGHIKDALDYLRKTESLRRITQRELAARPHRPELGPMKVVPLNQYSRKSETSEEVFYHEAISRGLKIWNVVQICQSAFQVQVLEDSAYDDLALELQNRATNDRMSNNRFQLV